MAPPRVPSLFALCADRMVCKDTASYHAKLDSNTLSQVVLYANTKPLYWRHHLPFAGWDGQVHAPLKTRPAFHPEAAGYCHNADSTVAMETDTLFQDAYASYNTPAATATLCAGLCQVATSPLPPCCTSQCPLQHRKLWQRTRARLRQLLEPPLYRVSDTNDAVRKLSRSIAMHVMYFRTQHPGLEPSAAKTLAVLGDLVHNCAVMNHFANRNVV